MTDAEYLKLPSYPLVPLSTAFRDARGTIQNLFTNGMQSGAILITKKGARRADHWHRTGNHLCVLISGAMEYAYRPVGSAEPPKRLRLSAANGPVAFYSPARVEHSMEFLEDSCFLSFDSLVQREHENYEADIVRLEKPLT